MNIPFPKNLIPGPEEMDRIKNGIKTLAEEIDRIDKNTQEILAIVQELMKQTKSE